VLGLSFSLVIQGMINMGVNVGLLPVTGQTLPLISKGGTSFWFTSISLGIILSVSRSIQEEEKVESLKQNRYVQA
jgi:cell division protein FtsW